MVKQFVESLYYMFTGHDEDTDDPVPYREKVQGVLIWLLVISFCILMLSLTQ